MTVDPKISQYMREINAKRKNKVGGFKSKETQKKIKEIKRAKSKNRQGRQTIQPVDKD